MERDTPLLDERQGLRLRLAPLAAARDLAHDRHELLLRHLVVHVERAVLDARLDHREREERLLRRAVLDSLAHCETHGLRPVRARLDHVDQVEVDRPVGPEQHLVCRALDLLADGARERVRAEQRVHRVTRV